MKQAVKLMAVVGLLSCGWMVRAAMNNDDHARQIDITAGVSPLHLPKFLASDL